LIVTAGRLALCVAARRLFLFSPFNQRINFARLGANKSLQGLIEAHFDLKRGWVFYAFGHAPHLTGNYPMATVDDIPHADALEIKTSQNGKWMLFDFIVGEKHAFVSMDTKNFPAVFSSLLATLNTPALASVPVRPLPTQGYFYAEAVKPREYATSITPLEANVVVAFELPGAVHFSVVLPLLETKRLQFAIGEAIQQCEARQNLPKQ
jgi:hypothetical protein